MSLYIMFEVGEWLILSLHFDAPEELLLLSVCLYSIIVDGEFRTNRKVTTRYSNEIRTRQDVDLTIIRLIPVQYIDSLT